MIFIIVESTKPHTVLTETKKTLLSHTHTHKLCYVKNKIRRNIAKQTLVDQEFLLLFKLY